MMFKIACAKGVDCLWPKCGPKCPNLGHPVREQALDALRQARMEALEEAAQECTEWAEAVEKVGKYKEQVFAYRNAAAAIRALKDKQP